MIIVLFEFKNSKVLVLSENKFEKIQFSKTI